MMNIKIRIPLYKMTILAGMLAMSGPLAADQAPSDDAKHRETVNARRIAENPIEANSIVWGEVVKDLQLGISPPSKTDGKALFEGGRLNVCVHLRNTGKSEVRLLASTYTCLALGSDGALLVSKIILTPAKGGEPITITYQGPNHLALLDKRRDKSEGWQATVAKGDPSGKDLQLDAEKVESLATVLSPGETLAPCSVTYTPGDHSNSAWLQTGNSNGVPAGKYKLKAVFVVDQKVSKWKGELTSGSLDVEIGQVTAK